MGSGSAVFLRNQGSKFLTFLGSGVKILNVFGIGDQNFGQKYRISYAGKNIPRYDPDLTFCALFGEGLTERTWDNRALSSPPRLAKQSLLRKLHVSVLLKMYVRALFSQQNKIDTHEGYPDCTRMAVVVWIAPFSGHLLFIDRNKWNSFRYLERKKM